VLLAVAVGTEAQLVPQTAHTLAVLPFENISNAPGLEWIGESFPEVLGGRMASPALYVVGREARLVAFDRLGIPTGGRPSRATLYRIAEELNVEYVVLGRYTFDGRTFTARAQILDMKQLRMKPEVSQAGPLVKLLEIQNGLAWELLRTLEPDLAISRNDFIALAPPVRLDAFENYIRGLHSTSRPEKIRYLREAVRRNPVYHEAILALGKLLFASRDYRASAGWLARIPRSEGLALEAQFFLGLDHYYTGEFERAQRAFEFVASRLPLDEVLNNLGVVMGRSEQASAAAFFRRAVAADSDDADYRFNLAVALERGGDRAGAVRELGEALARKPEDAEARELLQSLTAGKQPPAGSPLAQKSAAGPRKPLERIKLNYDEASYRRLALEIRNQNEQRLAREQPAAHARFHVQRGRALLEQGFVQEAEKEFREAILLDPTGAGGHAGLAEALERLSDPAAARAEARAALRLAPSANAFLVLARLDLRDNSVEAAAQNVERALGLEPENEEAKELRRTLELRRAERTQPGTQP